MRKKHLLNTASKLLLDSFMVPDQLFFDFGEFKTRAKRDSLKSNIDKAMNFYKAAISTFLYILFGAFFCILLLSVAMPNIIETIMSFFQEIVIV